MICCGFLSSVFFVICPIVLQNLLKQTLLLTEYILYISTSIILLIWRGY